jgi:hypothetical protein
MLPSSSSSLSLGMTRNDLAWAPNSSRQYAEEAPGIGKLEPDAPTRFDLRWYMMHRFPYALLVGSASGTRSVVAVAHLSRKPGYWKDRLIKLH